MIILGIFICPLATHSFPLDFLTEICQYIDMICINCFHNKTRVINSRKHKKYPQLWRRRSCDNCHGTFTTYEYPSIDDIPVVKKTTEEPFNIGRLTLSIAKSLQHNDHSAKYDSFHLAQTVQRNLLIKNMAKIPVDAITKEAHTVLSRYDPVAAIQYAAQHKLLISKRRPGRPSTGYVLPSIDH